MPLQLIIVIALALVFDFLNGVHGSSNIVASMVSSRALRPWTALVIIGIAEFIGPFLFGIAVARTVGAQIVDTDIVTLKILIASLISCVAWNLLTWFLGLPSSPSHGFVGGLIGATLIGAGASALKMAGLIKVLIALFGTPLVSFGFGFVSTRLVLQLAQDASPRINDFFKEGQLATAVFLALSQASNDAQKAMGLIVLGLIISHALPGFSVPLWVIAASAAGMMLGTVLAGARLIRTMGGKFYKIRPVNSFSAQAGSLLLIIISSFTGLPVSTTQVVSSAIIGSGASERFGKIRWSAANVILISWVLTIPATMALAAGVYWLLLKVTI
jgi:PiT family inorganic phosphate transporter